MSKRIAISGSSGLVGSALIPALESEGYSISRLVRSVSPTKTDPNIICWDIESGTIDASRLEGHDCVIHLAGANISDKRWTPQYKRIIKESRVLSTKLLAQTLANLTERPKVFLCASAVGYYGNHEEDGSIDESSELGNDFLAEVCEEWERSCKPASDAGIRVVQMRLGAVISKRGGALGKMLPIFKLGLGGRLGTGRQPMSWIALEEIPHIILHLIAHEEFSGPVNLVAPQAVSNSEFTKTLAKAIKRPAIFPVPDFGIRLLLGEMADALLLGGAKVKPARLLESGYQFKYPDLKSALEVSL